MRFLTPLALLPLLALGQDSSDDECPAPVVVTVTSTATTLATSVTPDAGTNTASASGAGGTDGPNFTLLAFRSGSPIHLSAIAANGGAFWIGKNTTTYCPDSGAAAAQCASATNDTTVLASGGNGLYVSVPGGQQVYAKADGALAFTQAHSASTESGALLGQGNYTAPTAGAGYGQWSYGKGLVACPDSANGSAAYQIFAEIDGKDFSRCTSFQCAATAWNNTAAWQYT